MFVDDQEAIVATLEATFSVVRGWYVRYIYVTLFIVSQSVILSSHPVVFPRNLDTNRVKEISLGPRSLRVAVCTHYITARFGLTARVTNVVLRFR